jgi:DNA-binding IclR family transcriptional regulator
MLPVECPITRPTKALEAVLRILEFLGGWRGVDALPMPTAAPLKTIAAATGIPEPTAHRTLVALVKAGWLERTGTDYALALKVGLLGLGMHAGLKAQAESLAGAISQLDAVADGVGR